MAIAVVNWRCEHSGDLRVYDDDTQTGWPNSYSIYLGLWKRENGEAELRGLRGVSITPSQWRAIADALRKEGIANVWWKRTHGKRIRTVQLQEEIKVTK